MNRGIQSAPGAAAVLGTMTSWGLSPDCPATVEQARAGGFETIGDGTFVGAGFAIRFVPAPDAEFRGYDLNVRQWIHGSPDEPGVFLLTEEIPGIRPGQPVLIIVEDADNGRGYRPGACQPLQPISEEDMLSSPEARVEAGRLSA